MTTETKYPFAKAHKAAEYIAQLLRPHCTRLHIAGSIRRLRPEVKDIEIVCEPKKEILKDLFGWNEGEYPDKNFIEALATITDIIIFGDVSGRMMKIRTNSKLCPGTHLDLFMPQPEDYYRQLAIRTGSADYVHHIIAGAWKRKGWAGVKDMGLRKISECDIHTNNNDKKTYTVKKDLAAVTLPPVWQSEGDFFTWLGLDYIDPEFREYHSTINMAQ